MRIVEPFSDTKTIPILSSAMISFLIFKLLKAILAFTSVILSSSESPEIDSAMELFDSQKPQEEESEFDLRIVAIFVLSVFIVREVLRKD